MCINFENVNISLFEDALVTSFRHGKVEVRQREGFHFMDIFNTFGTSLLSHESNGTLKRLRL